MNRIHIDAGIMMKLFHLRQPLPWLAIALSIVSIIILLGDAYLNPQPPLHILQFLLPPTVFIIVSSATLIRSQRKQLADILTYIGLTLGIISIGLIFAA